MMRSVCGSNTADNRLDRKGREPLDIVFSRITVFAIIQCTPNSAQDNRGLFFLQSVGSGACCDAKGISGHKQMAPSEAKRASLLVKNMDLHPWKMNK
ncbi:MAG: hypothetical protein HYV28_06545 [Ignavibacteriales bacterium]|nr:hypothetical protein [Ignavibacteriales bacterium]